MGVFTQVASNIKGFACKFACKSAYAFCVNGPLRTFNCPLVSGLSEDMTREKKDALKAPFCFRPNPHRMRDATRNTTQANGTCWCEWGVHTARKQHQRKNVPICQCVVSHVPCGLGLSKHRCGCVALPPCFGAADKLPDPPPRCSPSCSTEWVLLPTPCLCRLGPCRAQDRPTGVLARGSLETSSISHASKHWTQRKFAFTFVWPVTPAKLQLQLCPKRQRCEFCVAFQVAKKPNVVVGAIFTFTAIPRKTFSIFSQKTPIMYKFWSKLSFPIGN